MTIEDKDWLAARFEQHRGHLRSVAFRMLGSPSEAEDAVQEAWLRLSRSDPAQVQNLGGWLTTVVGRVCLDMLRARNSRREDALDDHAAEARLPHSDPEQEALLADSLGMALVVVLESLSPPERVALVLHDMFALPFDEIAPIVGRSPAATRQLASRARRRLHGSGIGPLPDRERQRQIVDAFLAASRAGEFEALVSLLDPAITLRGDAAVVAMGAAREVRGAAAVAQTFAGRARGAQPAWIGAAAGLVWLRGGRPRVAFRFEFGGGRVTGIEMIADPERIGRLQLEIPAAH